MHIPLIALLVFVVALLVYAFATNSKVLEVARAAIWTSLLVIVWANLTVHVVRL